MRRLEAFSVNVLGCQSTGLLQLGLASGAVGLGSRLVIGIEWRVSVLRDAERPVMAKARPLGRVGCITVFAINAASSAVLLKRVPVDSAALIAVGSPSLNLLM